MKNLIETALETLQERKTRYMLVKGHVDSPKFGDHYKIMANNDYIGDAYWSPDHIMKNPNRKSHNIIRIKINGKVKELTIKRLSSDVFEGKKPDAVVSDYLNSNEGKKYFGIK